MRSLVLGFLLCAIHALPLGAQPQCKKGKPCGNSCIAANKTCHIGTAAPQAKSIDSAARLLTIPAKVTGDSAWVASFADGVYFLASCPAAQDLAPANRRYFKTEESAKVTGYRKSRTPGC